MGMATAERQRHGTQRPRTPGTARIAPEPPRRSWRLAYNAVGRAAIQSYWLVRAADASASRRVRVR